MIDWIIYADINLKKVLIFIGLIIIQFSSNNIINWTVFSLLVIIFLCDIISSIIFSNKIFACLNCEHNFKPKWYKLALSDWRNSRNNRVYKELTDGECEKIRYKCPGCKSRECVIKQKVVVT